MLRRIFWFAVGLGLGFGLSVWAARALRQTAERYTPESMAGRLADALRDFGESVRIAVQEGRAAMAEREEELRTRFDQPPSLASAQGSGGNGHGGNGHGVAPGRH